MHTRFLLHCLQTRCGCWGHRGQVIAGLTAHVLRFAESYPSISAFSFVDDRHFLIIVPIMISVFARLDSLLLKFKFKLIVITPAMYYCLAVAVTWLLRASGDMHQMPYSSPKAGLSASYII